MSALEALRRLGVDAAAALVRSVQDVTARGAQRAVAVLEAHGYRASDPAVAQLAAQLNARAAELDGARRATTAVGRELTAVRREAAQQVQAAQRDRDNDVQRWVERAQENSELLGDVWQVLLEEHGRSDLLRDRDVTLPEGVRRALTDGPPVGEQITERIAEVIWQAGRQAPASQHAFLSEPVCREIAYALAPLLANWARTAARDSDAPPAIHTTVDTTNDTTVVAAVDRALDRLADALDADRPDGPSAPATSSEA